MRRGFKEEYCDYVWVDVETKILTFPLWSCTGQLLGYQQYNFRTDKSREKDRKSRYYPCIRRDWLSFWGLEFLDLSSKDPLYVVEGIWDAIRVLNAGYRCIAVLSNNPKKMKNLLTSLPCKTVALCDGDESGKLLAKVCDESIILPEGKDCNDMTEEELKEIINE